MIHFIKKIIPGSVFNSIIICQAISNSGMLSLSSLTSNDIPNGSSSYELSIGYIPTLSIKKYLSSGDLLDAEWAYYLKNDYLAFSGIGNHQTFISMIRNNGMKIIKDIEFPDHFQFSEKDINEILRISKELNCKIITTEKDFLRISSKKTDQIKFIKSDLHILDEEKFINAIIN